MKKHNLKDFTKGWFMGDFDPSLFQTKDFEISIRKYNKGDSDSGHYHKILTEYTVIISGSVRMNGTVYTEGDIITVFPKEKTDFETLVDGTITTVIKVPSSKNDKYI